MENNCQNRIAKIDGDKVYITKSDGTKLCVNRSNLDCTIKVGQQVEVFQTNEQIIITDAICSGKNDNYNNEKTSQDNTNQNSRFQSFGKSRSSDNNSYDERILKMFGRSRVKKVPFILLTIIAIVATFFTGGTMFLVEKLYAKKYMSFILGLIFSLNPFTRFIPMFMVFYDLLIAVSNYQQEDGYIIV